jgi:hypothetical protein
MNLASNEWREQIKKSIPKGWWKAFGERMCDDLQNALLKLPSAAIENFEIIEVKDKLGSLRFNTNWQTNEIISIMTRYEDLSAKTCCACGAPATKVSTESMSPWCDRHAPLYSIPFNEYIYHSIREVNI